MEIAETDFTVCGDSIIEYSDILNNIITLISDTLMDESRAIEWNDLNKNIHAPNETS